jgi:hypothetical protein
MAICRPKAIDDAPVFGPERLRRTAAVRLSWLARGMGEAQGKKVDPQPLRPGDRGPSRPSAKSSHQRSRGSPGPTASRRRRGGYRMIRTRDQARRAKEKKPWRTDGRTLHGPDSRPHSTRTTDDIDMRHGSPRSKRSSEGRNERAMSRIGDQRSAPQPPFETTNGGAQPSLAAGLSGPDDIAPAAMPCPASGGAEIAMRAQAVAATTIAPVTARTCRQPSAGTPKCARPSAA